MPILMTVLGCSYFKEKVFTIYNDYPNTAISSALIRNSELLHPKVEKKRSHYAWTGERSRGGVPGPENLLFFSMRCADCRDNPLFLLKYLSDLNGNALLSSRDNPDTLCMIFDVSVWFLEISQLPAACFSSSRYLQEQHICLNHAAQKHLSLFLHSCCLSLFSSSCSPRHCATCLELHWCSPINWPCADGMKELHGENREQL